jgi:flavin reductase (DIM6/NTAB) family NADH-FMN oxidoreductase RutF
MDTPSARRPIVALAGSILIPERGSAKESLTSCSEWGRVSGIPLDGCYIWDENHSFSLIRRSKACVINIPTFDLMDAVIGVGNTHGGKVDKFQEFNLTPVDASKVDAPLIAECYASFECSLVDGSMINRYGLFVFEVVKAHVATSPRYPTTVHYRGDGVFMISGRGT